MVYAKFKHMDSNIDVLWSRCLSIEQYLSLTQPKSEVECSTTGSDTLSQPLIPFIQGIIVRHP